MPTGIVLVRRSRAIESYRSSVVNQPTNQPTRKRMETPWAIRSVHQLHFIETDIYTVRSIDRDKSIEDYETKLRKLRPVPKNPLLWTLYFDAGLSTLLRNWECVTCFFQQNVLKNPFYFIPCNDPHVDIKVLFFMSFVCAIRYGLKHWLYRTPKFSLEYSTT